MTDKLKRENCWLCVTDEDYVTAEKQINEQVQILRELGCVPVVKITLNPSDTYVELFSK